MDEYCSRSIDKSVVEELPLLACPVGRRYIREELHVVLKTSARSSINQSY